jgi:hypothetical protein
MIFDIALILIFIKIMVILFVKKLLYLNFVYIDFNQEKIFTEVAKDGKKVREFIRNRMKIKNSLRKLIKPLYYKNK